MFSKFVTIMFCSLPCSVVYFFSNVSLWCFVHLCSHQWPHMDLMTILPQIWMFYFFYWWLLEFLVILQFYLVGIDKIPCPACSGRVQYRGFLRGLRLKACPLSEKVSYQIAQHILNIMGLNLNPSRIDNLSLKFYSEFTNIMSGTEYCLW